MGNHSIEPPSLPPLDQLLPAEPLLLMGAGPVPVAAENRARGRHGHQPLGADDGSAGGAHQATGWLCLSDG